MSQIDETTVDVDDVIRRIQAVRRGELPDGSVSIEELRAALQAQRNRFASGAIAGASERAAPERKKVSTKTKLIVDLGGL